MGPHIGDLQNASTHATLEWTIDDMKLFSIQPEKIIVDSHPQFSPSQGERIGKSSQISVIPINIIMLIASVRTLHLEGPVLGIAMDGTGYGPDGTVWGGEFLLCKKVRISPVQLNHEAPFTGGGKAVSRPWRQTYGIQKLLW